MNEQTIVDYLLGNLPEADLERLDQLSIADDDFAALLSAKEHDLVDAYVRGELSSGERDRFVSHYLASPLRREKANFARVFHEKIQQERAAPVQQESLVTRISKLFAVPRFSLQWGFAAATLLILLAGGYLMMSNLRLRDEIRQTQAGHSALQQRAQQLQSRLTQQSSSENKEEVARLQQELADLKLQIAESTKNEPVRQPEVKLIALNLSPQMRGISRIPLLTIPGGTDFVAMTLEMETNEFSAYQVRVKNPANGQSIWQSARMKPEGRSDSILVAVPAGILYSQNYIVELFGVSRNGDSEIISSYPFRVVTQ